MQVYPEKLAHHLEKTPASFYWIAGDDPLLTQEACDTVRTRARAMGFAERKVFFVERKEHWQAALAEANALSLFADRILLDIRCALGKVDAELILQYLQHPNPDTLILLQTPRPDAKSALKKALEHHCAFVPVYPLDSSRFPAWLADRARQRKLAIAPAALALLTEQTEGNLLAALQELDKLSLRFGTAPVTLEDMESEVTNSSRYEVFALNDALLKGDVATSLKILHALQLDGSQPLAIHGALMGDLRKLAAASEAMAGGTSLQAAVQQLNAWPKHKPALFQRALTRLGAPQTRHLLKHMSTVDLASKGMDKQDPWGLLRELCLLMCPAI